MTMPNILFTLLSYLGFIPMNYVYQIQSFQVLQQVYIQQ